MSFPEVHMHTSGFPTTFPPALPRSRPPTPSFYPAVDSQNALKKVIVEIWKSLLNIGDGKEKKKKER